MNLRWAVALLAFLLAVSDVATTTREKCLHSSSVYPTTYKRFFKLPDLNKTDIPITVQASNRASHQLVSQILSYMVQELLGYENVEISQVDGNNASHILDNLSVCPSPSNTTCIPPAMINMEVWLSPGFNLESWTTGDNQRIVDGGPLGPVGRSEWYVPLSYNIEKWEKKQLIVDHWRAFKRKDIAQEFNLRKYNDTRLSRMTLLDPGNKHKIHFCRDENVCTKGIYTPERCKNDRHRCAILLSDYPQYTLSILQNDINTLELLVEVAFVGKNLDFYVRTLMDEGIPVLFFNWKPNTLTLSPNITSIFFPHCGDGITSFLNKRNKSPIPDDSYCEAEIHLLQKLIWPGVKEHLPDVYSLVRKMFFNQSDYLKLIEGYYNGTKIGIPKPIESVACTWLKNNWETWHNWLPEGMLEKPTLYIGGIFPKTGDYLKQDALIVAANLAIDAVNRNESVLSKFTLQLDPQDGACQPDIVMRAFIHFISQEKFNRYIGILGPACSETIEPIAGLARHFNTIIVSYSAEGSLFHNRKKYPYFFRTIPENNVFCHVYKDVLFNLKWRRVAAITEDGQKYPEYISALQELLKMDKEKDIQFIKNQKIPRNRNHNNMETELKDLKNIDARIIIGDFYDKTARAVMCEAFKQNMTARYGYQWFLPLWFSDNWYDVEKMNYEKNENVPCTTAQMIQAIDGHMSLAYKFYANNDSIMQTGKTVKEWRVMYDQLSQNQREIPSKYGGYAYDAVWMYALALNELLKEHPDHLDSLHSVQTSRAFVSLLNKTDFMGVSGKVQFSGSGRLSEVEVWQWLAMDNGTWLTRKVGAYNPWKSLNKLNLNETRITWRTPTGTKPSDRTWSEDNGGCLLEGLRRALNVDCELAIVVANLMGLSLFIILVMAVFIFFKRKYDEKVKLTEARIRELGLVPSSGLLLSDEWEMQRDHIVINRKLGEGAFGTVYGGEALVDEKGWVAVAVKTLKVGANMEEKLDFLSEAEMMKRFEHSNVVKLLGVCTIGEPVYTIMEFMLYGDLKTYLLARRQLVKENGRHSTDEVSDRQLTTMALDIARGLSYLAELKYVHRDLACRNCLVNATRTIKIADFGMCRPMYDSDYYRFNKRGMLPVRWMAPESLIDGLFTAASDIWSYGVLLYEIVTFGSFPYQGLSNNQVFEYVTNFNTLSVPKGCKPELETLFLRCWKRNIVERPSANEILEILAEHPSLISPCLDMPSASVEVEDTNSIELAIHERSRVHSITSATNPVRRILDRRSSLGQLENGSATINLDATPPPISYRTRVINSKGHYVTLQSGKTSQCSDYGSSASKELGQGITAL